MTNPSIASDLIPDLFNAGRAKAVGGDPSGTVEWRAAEALSQLTGRIETLFDAIAHGDDEHRAWLKEAIDAHFAGQPVPECRGKGRKEAALCQLTREVDELREALEAADERLCELTPRFPPDVGPDMRDVGEIEKTGAVVMQIREALSRSSGRVSDATE